MGNAKKKNPPGILDWVADFFVSPIKNAIAGLVTETSTIISAVAPEQVQAKFKPAIDTVLAQFGAATTTSSSLTPEEGFKRADDWTKATKSWFDTYLLTAVALEMGSLGQLDVSPSMILQAPHIRAFLSISSDLYIKAFDAIVGAPLQRYLNKEYTPLLPGYQDMIGIYVREGYLEDHQVELPPEFAENMKELGYGEEWTRQLWGKHWVLPGVELLYDMFHKKIIDYETLALMLKFHDFLPEWRDRLIQNAYELIPRVDLRRAYMYAVQGYEDLVTPYEKLGYSPQDAKTMDQIAKRFALEAHYSRLLTVARASYRKGQLGGSDFQAILERIHIPPAAQDLILEAETLAKLSGVKDPGEEPYIPSRTDMKQMAEWGQITPEELQDLAEADGVDPAWAPRVAEAWLLNQLRDELGKIRGVYEDLLEAGFMDKKAFRSELEGLHFAPHVVDALLRWADAKLDLDEKKELAKEYEALAKDGVITPEQYGQALRELKMVEDRITRKMKYVKRLLEVKALKAAAKAKG